ncbi:MAG: hypothetical protein OIF48_11795 [Silicimonas sp.]|nr:hypothetical protein [Silicimonas sp.]
MGPLALPALRAILVSGVARKWPTPKIREAARFADTAASASISAALFVSDTAVAVHTAATTAAESAHSAAGAIRSAVSAVDYAGSVAAFSVPTINADSARSAAFSSVAKDAVGLLAGPAGPDLFNHPLWPDGGVPDFFEKPYADLLDFWDAEPATWNFWQRWYAGMLDGAPLDWEVQRDVALIPDGIWKKGPKAVAEAIAEIERDLKRPELDPEALTRQAQTLYANSAATLFLCRAIADEITAATRINTLPDAFEVLRELPPVLNLIAELVQSKERIGELEAQIAVLADQVLKLTRDLEAKSDKTRTDRILDTVETTSVQVLTTTFWGLVGGGITYLLGFVEPTELVDRFASAIAQCPLQSPLDTPPSHEGPKFLKPPQ